MNAIPMLFSRMNLDTIETNINRVPVDKKHIIKNITIANKSDTAIKVTVNLSGLALLHNRLIDANDTLILSLSLVMESDDVIQAYCDQQWKACMFISGVEIDRI